MKVLAAPRATPEQLRVIGSTQVGVEVIRGAAGSGKTTTALLRLRNLSDMFSARKARLGLKDPVRALVLTFNRTLCGYVEALAREQSAKGGNVQIEVLTYAKWAHLMTGEPTMVGNRTNLIIGTAAWRKIILPSDFKLAEVEYVMGRFLPNQIGNYISAERTGRGAVPRVDRAMRGDFVTLIEEYRDTIQKNGLLDWEDLPPKVALLAEQNYDIVVVDEAQDFSANQVRSLLPHLAQTHSLTLVIDTAQRLYPRGYAWAEVGLTVRQFHRLKRNHRNTIEIAAFAKGIIAGVRLDDDGTIPDLSAATEHGEVPQVVVGRFSRQLDYAIKRLSQVDLANETVAFLHPLGGGWFDAIREGLTKAGYGYEEISRQVQWPNTPTNIVLSTMHSAKGLEFDHVIMLGLSNEVTPFRRGTDEDADDDDKLQTLRRLLAMAVARARRSVVVGYKSGEASGLVRYFEPGTFDEQKL